MAGIDIKLDFVPTPDELEKMLDALIKESETQDFKLFLSAYAICKRK